MKSFTVKFSELEMDVAAENFEEAAEEAFMLWFKSNEIPTVQYPSCEVIDTDTSETKIVDIFIRYVPLCYGKERE